MCDTLIAIGDDGVLFGKNSDRDPNEAQGLRWHPAADHPEGAPLRCTWSTIPQARHTHAVLLSQPWWMWGAEMGANEHGVVIGNEAVFTRGAPRTTTGSELLGMDLLRLALERAQTAEAAVGVIVELLERHGQGGSCSHEHPRFTYDSSFLVADRTGGWVLETAGRAWAAERVTGAGRSISNGLSIEHFARAFADRAREQVSRCATRRALTEAAARRATSPADVIAALRAHEGNTPRWNPVTGALGGPCAHAGGALASTQTTASWAADLRGAADVHLVTGTSAPCLSTFVPVSVGMPCAALDTAPTGLGAALRNVHDPAYRWWRHEVLHRTALRDHAAALAVITPERDRLEAAWLADPDPALATERVAEVDRAEEQWLAEILARGLSERRPSWLRALWSRQDGAAHLPETERSAS